MVMKEEEQEGERREGRWKEKGVRRGGGRGAAALGTERGRDRRHAEARSPAWGARRRQPEPRGAARVCPRAALTGRLGREPPL